MKRLCAPLLLLNYICVKRGELGSTLILMIKALKWMLLFLGLRELKKDQPLRVRWGSSADRKDMALSSQIMRRTPSLSTSQSMYLYYNKNFIYKWDQYLSGEKICREFMFILLIRIVLLWLVFHYSLDLEKKCKIIDFMVLELIL